jgi:hypothetical protein
MRLRAHVITALAGLIAPFLLVELISLATIYVWFPDPAGVVPVVLGALLGCAMALALARVARSQPMSQWLLFTGFFLIAVGVPTLVHGEYQALLAFLTRPFVAAFLAFAALGFWLASRRKVSRHVA